MPIDAILLNEYATGGSRASLVTHLPTAARRVGGKELLDETLRRMKSDPEIAAALKTLRTAVTADGVSVLPSIPDDEQAIEIADFTRQNLMGLQRTIESIIESMMDAMVYGYKIAEQTYEQRNGKFWLKSIKSLKQGVVRYVVDRHWNILGFVAVENTTLLLPRDKFISMSMMGEDEDPRGISMLEPCLVPWDFKTNVWPEFFRWVTTNGVPGLLGVTAPDSSGTVPKFDPTGAPVLDDDGNQVFLSPTQALLEALLAFRNAYAMAVPAGADVRPINSGGSADNFTHVLDSCDAQMRKALLLTTLATGEGIHQTRASSTIQMSVLEMFIWWLKNKVATTFERDCFRPLVRYNYGEAALSRTPKMHLGDVERRDFAATATAVSSLYGVKYLSPEQLLGTDALLGLPPRDTPAIEARREEIEEEREEEEEEREEEEEEEE